MQEAQKPNPISPGSFIKELFNLHEDKERSSTAIAKIKNGVAFRGANLKVRAKEDSLVIIF